ncbi:hypothetical protein KC221_25420, partial [Mycobacterium tuberculosis]|nr:hypothetical protein [Mycobacterium tuberculosis]
ILASKSATFLSKATALTSDRCASFSFVILVDKEVARLAAAEASSAFFRSAAALAPSRDFSVWSLAIPL